MCRKLIRPSGRLERRKITYVLNQAGISRVKQPGCFEFARERRNHFQLIISTRLRPKVGMALVFLVDEKIASETCFPFADLAEGCQSHKRWRSQVGQLVTTSGGHFYLQWPHHVLVSTLQYFLGS